MLCLRFLGGAAIQVAHGAPGGRAGRARRLALLALLSTARTRAVTREKLIAYLWPKVEARQGRRLLSESLYVLRKALGGGALVSDGDSIRFDRELFAMSTWEQEYGVPARFRMGEIHERLGNPRMAARYYTQFLERWEGCDPELQPRIDQAERSLKRLSVEG